MSPAAVVSVLLVLLLTRAATGLPTRPEPLRNVIITSFGEMPYEPAEQGGGFFQSDVYSVSLNGNDPPETMDVALRTGILVEDPNEKKEKDEEPLEDEQTVNIKRQASDKKTARNERFQIDEEDFLIPRSKVTQMSSAKVVPTRSFGYEFRQTKQQRHPSSPGTDANGYNINTEYDGDLGEGWSLQDAEALLRGRNFNVLVQPHRYPSLPPRETPPPVSRHFPGFDYSPFPVTNRRSEAPWPYPQPTFVSDDYLSGY